MIWILEVDPVLVSQFIDKHPSILLCKATTIARIDKAISTRPTYIRLANFYCIFIRQGGQWVPRDHSLKHFLTVGHACKALLQCSFSAVNKVLEDYCKGLDLVVCSSIVNVNFPEKLFGQAL